MTYYWPLVWSSCCYLLRNLFSILMFPPVCTSNKNERRKQCKTHYHAMWKLITFSSSWYFMILWTGLIRRSLSCSLWPSCCRRSCRHVNQSKMFECAVKYTLCWITRLFQSDKRRSGDKLNSSLMLCSHLKVGLDVLWDDMFRLGFVLAVNHVHVKSPLLQI